MHQLSTVRPVLLWLSGRAPRQKPGDSAGSIPAGRANTTARPRGGSSVALIAIRSISIRQTSYKTGDVVDQSRFTDSEWANSLSSGAVVDSAALANGLSADVAVSSSLSGTYASIVTSPLGSTAANFTDATTRRGRAAVARLLAGTSDLRLLGNGDSMTAGTGTTLASQHWLKQVANRLAVRLGVTVGDGPIGLAPGGFASQRADTQVTVGAGWGTLSTYPLTPSPLAMANVGTTTSTDIAFTETVDGANVMVYTGGGNTGNLIYSWDAVGIGSATTVTQSAPSGPYGLTSYAITAPTRGTHTLHLWQAGSGSKTYYASAEPQDSTTRKIRWVAQGVNGNSSTDMVSWYNGTSNLNAEFSAAALIDIHFLAIGINDQMQAGSGAPMSIATHTANLAAVLAKITAKSTRSMVIKISQAAASTEASYPLRLSAFNDADDSWGGANGVPCVRLDKRWQDFTTANAQGYFSDTIHPGPVGYADWGVVVAEPLVTHLT